MKIKSLWFEFDEWENGFDESDANTDVHFELDDGTKWCASFYTYQNLLTLSHKNKKTGECLSGEYFYAHKPIFISRISKELIVSVLEDIILTESELSSVFTRIPPSFT
ncbi:MAG: hypothetical protein IJ368_02960 [Oscillospiraceae bacterium]|nr:hypothetical protein [Oscillospiraceae bacterium]